MQAITDLYLFWGNQVKKRNPSPSLSLRTSPYLYWGKLLKVADNQYSQLGAILSCQSFWLFSYSNKGCNYLTIKGRKAGKQNKDFSLENKTRENISRSDQLSQEFIYISVSPKIYNSTLLSSNDVSCKTCCYIISCHFKVVVIMSSTQKSFLHRWLFRTLVQVLSD